jgi:hypothetical protein
VRKIISRISDSALRIVLREASAGACVTETGQVCKCLSESSCGEGKSTWKVFRVACNGQCLLSQTICEATCVVSV